MRLCWPQWIFIFLVLFLGIGSMLAGCGQKGPLYLPKAEPKSVDQKTESSDEITMDPEEKQKKKQE